MNSSSSSHTSTASLPLEAARDILARNLSAARGALGMSQEQLAEAADVSRATIIQIEAAEGDPRLSTLAGVASALGVSPVLLLLGRDELDAIANAPGSSEAERLKDNLSSDELDTMRRLLDSGIAKNRTKAVAIAASAATAAGLTAGTLASAAIGTAILPGIGTAIGVALGVWMTRKRASDLKLLTTTTDEPPATQKPS